VVGVDNGVLADGAQSFTAEGFDVGECAQEDAEVAVEGRHLADAFLRRGEAISEAWVLCSSFDKLRMSGKRCLAPGNKRGREVRCEVRLDANRPSTGTASAVRCGE